MLADRREDEESEVLVKGGTRSWPIEATPECTIPFPPALAPQPRLDSAQMVLLLFSAVSRKILSIKQVHSEQTTINPFSPDQLI